MRYIHNMSEGFNKKGYKRFFMPGHKGRTGYINDLTETDGTDDLSCPSGAILAANRRIADIYGFDYATMATFGSTGCIQAMMLCVKGKVLMGRNCHKAALNAAYLFNIETEFFSDVSTGGYLDAIASTDAKWLYITYPDYYGKAVDAQSIVEAARAKGMKIIADCAHGAHFVLDEALPDLPKADMLCVSVHKTMGALTGGAAVMCVNEFANKLRDNVFRIHSTSPSYIIMESIDDAFDFADENKGLIKEWICECKNVRSELLKRNMLLENDDVTRIIVQSQGYSGYKIYEEYKRAGILAEMADNERAVFITSYYDIESISALLDVSLERRDANEKAKTTPTGKRFESVYWCKDKEKTLLHYKDAAGAVSCAGIGAYPPGTAAVLPGEIITDEVIAYMEETLKSGGKLFGVDNDERILVAKI